MCDGYPVYTDWCNPESRVDQEVAHLLYVTWCLEGLQEQTFTDNE